MNYNETLEYIHSLGMFSHPAGLERISELLKALDYPQKSIKAVHIAGTNGKGSTATFISSVFRAAGLKTALFISPFVIDFRERIQINGEFIPKVKLCKLAERVKRTGIAVTEFEFITAVAFLYFAEEKCDIAVIETGLGGRLDATNTLTDVCASVITKIGLDHTAILGNTFTQIATEKCGIIKNDNTICAVNQPKTAFAVIKKQSKKLIVPDKRSLKIIKTDISGNEFYYRGVHYKTALGGKYQIDNALTAIETIHHCGIEIDEECIVRGLADASFPARLEVLHRNPLIVLDGAHNPDGGAALEIAMRKYSGKITAIVGMMKDKNCSSFLKKVLPHCKSVITVRASSAPRSLEAQTLADLCRKYCDDVVASDELSKAIEIALKQAKDEPIFIFGSLYLASSVRSLLLAL